MMNRSTFLAMMVGVTFACESLAQGSPAATLPSQAAIEQEMQRIEADRQQMFAGPDAVKPSSSVVAPNLPAPRASGIDIEQLARQYALRSAGQAESRASDLMIFASFTMPEASLKRLVHQANLAGGTLVFRGFRNNSIRETAKAIHALREQGGNVQINPQAFTKYRVNAVPAFVLTQATTAEALDEQGCALPDTYVSVAGDVSLDYALDALAQRSKAFSALASRYLATLSGQP